MATTIESTQYGIVPELAERQKYALSAIIQYARSHMRALREVRSLADQALSRMENGELPAGLSIGGGPLGFQPPADVTISGANLRQSISMAHMLGCTQDEIDDAYLRGARGELTL